MNTVILAAGIGKRLLPFTAEHPKCLLAFGGKSLLRRHLEMMDAAGVQKIAIVVGHLADQVEAEVKRVHCRVSIELVYNPQYELGSALSLLKAEAAFQNLPAIIMDADLLFCRVMADRILESPAPNCLLVDDRLVDTGEEVKVVAGPNGIVCGLGKQVRREGTVVGESVGIYKFSADTNNKLITGLRLAVAENPKVEYEAVIDSLLEQIEMRYVPVGDLSWIEIDFAADVDRANTETWPAIVNREKIPLLTGTTGKPL
jgi:choline kinase